MVGGVSEAAIDSIERTYRGYLKEVALELSQEGRMRYHQPKQVARGIVDGRNGSSQVFAELVPGQEK